MIKKLLNHESKSIAGGAFVIAVFYLINGALAILRNAFLAGHFGASRQLDIYYAAFRIPDFIYVILISGAISAGFIPLFAEKLFKSREEAWKFSNNILTTLTFILAGGALLVAIFAPFLVRFIVPGFDSQSQKSVADLVRIMMIQPVLLGISNIIVGILQNFKRFFITSLAPVFYNLGIIIGILVFVPFMGLKGLAWGVVFGALLHLLVQLPSVKNLGFSFKFLPDFRSENLKKIFSLMVPRTLGLISIQINFLIITIVASTLAKGSLAIFNFANDLQSLPQNIFAISFAISVFPILSQLSAKREEFLKTFKETIKNILFFMVPIAVFYLVLRAQIARLALGYGRFGWDETIAVIDMLGIFAFGMIGQSLLPFIVRAFFSVKDSIRPFLAGIISNVLNVVLSLILSKAFGVRGLAIAFAIAGYSNLLLLWFFLKKKFISLGETKITPALLRIGLAAFIAGLAIVGYLRILDYFVDTHKVLGLLVQAVIAASLGLVSYLAILAAMKAPETEYLRKFLRFNKKALTTEENFHE